MSLVNGNQPVQTFPTHRADQSFAKRVGLRRPDPFQFDWFRNRDYVLHRDSRGNIHHRNQGN